MKDNKSSILGIEGNVIVLVGYLGGLFLSWIIGINYFAWLLPLILYIIEKKNEFIKEQMAQATVLYIFVSIIMLIFNLIWIIMFPESYKLGLNLENFSGSTLIVSTMNILSVTIAIIITLIVINTSMKTWYYENYKIPIIRFFVPKFRSLLSKVMKNSKTNKEKVEEEKQEEIKEEEKKNEEGVKTEENKDNVSQKRKKKK